LYCALFAEIKITLLVITHTIVPVNLHSSPKVRRSAPVHPTKTTFANLASHSHWTERDVRPRPLLWKNICAPARQSLYKAMYQIWSL